ncbi:hypothetical protein OF829_12985 [Sphingomonas sp. LB-2]|uniref:hypothetical protein n=1 Tax=Sphingomonas caeni TaxID=2984949 RepID=UPI0022305393|nr:hypothetical protein [Sphingomonas caeni]MCW3848156.1 hypothetical protein [Sphingomonas caeni]
MRRAILAVGMFVMLGGCPSGPATNNTVQPTPTPTSTPQPTPWLTADPVCSGQITRAEWLVCDNKQLNDLHRKLAWQWQTERQNATPERMQVLEDQLYALLSERDNCQDAACIATAYRRYLAGPAPLPNPRPTTKPKPKPRPKPKPHRGPHQPRGDNDDGDWGPSAGERSCTAEIGPAAAARLSQQCDIVTQGNDRLCSTRRSCDAIREQTEHGCRETYRKPGFCRL